MLHVIEIGAEIQINDARLLLDNPLGYTGYSFTVRFGRYPYDPGWKSASKIGSRMSFNAPWTTRSRMAGIDRTRTFLPPSFGISFFRARMGRYVLVTNSSRTCFRKLSTPLSSMASNVTPSMPGAPSLLFAIW